MALYKKLTGEWRLTDGILPEMELSALNGVYEALREHGQVRAAEIGLNAMACEWISARRWVYSTLFEAPDEDDDYAYIELPRVSGSGAAYVNGEKAAEFESGAARFEVSGKLIPGEENRLEIRFEPSLYERPGNESPLPLIGLMAAPVLRTANYAAVEQFSLTSRLDGRTGVLETALTVQAHAEGKYTFRYALMSGEGEVTELAVSEELTEGRHALLHEVRVERAVVMDAERLEDTVYTLKFTLERGSVGCDVRHMETAFRSNKAPARCFAVRAWPVAEETLGQMKEAGADGIVLSGRPENAFEKNDYLDGLTVLEGGECAKALGMVSAEKLIEYADGEEYWPVESALWRLRGGKPESDGSGAAAEPFAAAMRLHQSARILQESMKARREEQPFIARWDEDFGYFVSDALVEKDGSERPALETLRESWRSAYALCELPESGCAKPDAPIQLSVWAMAEELGGQVLKASVSVMNLRGEEIASTSFPVMGGGVRMAGVIGVRTPAGEGLLVIRTELHEAHSGLIRRMDSVLAVGEGNAVDLMARCGRISETGVEGFC